MKKFNWFIFTFLAFAIFACDDEAVLDTEVPVITISSPTSNQEFQNDESVLVTATVVDNLGLDAVTIWVTPPGGAPQLVHTESVSDFLNDSRKAVVEETIALGTGTVAAGSYIVTVRAVDDRGNENEQSVTLVVAEADAVAPAITIVSPETGATFELGSDMTIDADIADAMNLASVNVMVVSGANNTIYDSTITEFTDPTLLDFTEVVTIPADANVGTYTLTITAVDVAGNENTDFRTFDVMEAAAGQMVTFTLTGLPANTPEDAVIFVAGEFADGTWVAPGENDAFALTKNADGTWSITLEAAPGEDDLVEFKFARQGGWATVEAAADCADINNRILDLTTATELTDIEVVAWKDLCP